MAAALMHLKGQLVLDGRAEAEQTYSQPQWLSRCCFTASSSLASEPQAASLQEIHWDFQGPQPRDAEVGCTAWSHYGSFPSRPSSPTVVLRQFSLVHLDETK